MKVLKNMLAVITFVVAFVSAGYVYMQVKSIQQAVARMEVINKESGTRCTYQVPEIQKPDEGKYLIHNL